MERILYLDIKKKPSFTLDFFAHFLRTDIDKAETRHYPMGAKGIKKSSLAFSMKSPYLFRTREHIYSIFMPSILYTQHYIEIKEKPSI